MIVLFIKTITHWVRQHAQVSVADEAKYYDHSVACDNQDEEATPLATLNGMLPVSSQSSTEKARQRPYTREC